MKLEKLKYSQFEGQSREWKLDQLEFEDTNLLVGKNASGKSKTLNVINGLAKLLTGELQPIFQSGSYDAIFDHEGKKLHYVLNFESAKITKEVFESDGEILLERGAGGVGKLLAVKQGGFIDFQTPDSQLAALARRDTIQHPYFEPLHQWGNSVHYYPFGTSLGKEKLTVFIKDDAKKPISKDPDSVIKIFKKGEKELGAKFVDSITQGMLDIGYPIESVGLMTPISIFFETTESFSREVVGLSVKEKNLNTHTDQLDMSQGMFRALAVIIHITYAEMVTHPSCILIDDIGEGLDFDRSSTLIELLIQRANASRIQLIMSTNDRFIMNKVPLKVWTILKRDGSHLHAYNYKNSKSIFDQFEMTGLNNFDFFSMEFVK